jgi:hypothetical protein
MSLRFLLKREQIEEGIWSSGEHWMMILISQDSTFCLLLLLSRSIELIIWGRNIDFESPS